MPPPARRQTCSGTRSPCSGPHRARAPGPCPHLHPKGTARTAMMGKQLHIVDPPRSQTWWQGAPGLSLCRTGDTAPAGSLPLASISTRFALQKHNFCCCENRAGSMSEITLAARKAFAFLIFCQSSFIMNIPRRAAEPVI